MKKKAIKLATSTAIAASAFVAGAPVNKADAAVNVDQLVTDAQNAGTVLKWAISVEGSADYVTRPYDQYNAAKKAIAAAEKAIKGLGASEKIKYEAKLIEPNIQVKRAAAYIDAITSSEKIIELTNGLSAAVKTGDLSKVEAAYHKATAEYRKQAALLDRVYGQSTRDGIRNAVKPALEKLVAEYKYDVTVKMALDKVAEATKAKDWTKAAAYMAEAEKYLPQVTTTFKDQLTKSKDDALAALPLAPVSATRIDDTTVSVKFNKEVDVISTAHFAFDKSLTVTDVKYGADKKTVIVTTTLQGKGETYKLFYKGVETSVTFSTAVNPGDNSVVVSEKDDLYLKATDTRAFSVALKNTDGSAYRGFVDITENDDVKVTIVNGKVVASAADLTNVVPNEDGKITITIQGTKGLTDVSEGSVTFLHKTSGKKDTTPKTTFVPAASEGDRYTNNVTVQNFDKSRKFVVAGNEWYLYDSSDKFFLNGSEITLAKFEELSNIGNTIAVNYQYDHVNNKKLGASYFNITHVNTLKGLTLDAKQAGTKVDKPLRVAPNEYFKLAGKAHPGYNVHVYYGTTTKSYLGTAQVDSAGTFNYQVNLANYGLGEFTLVQQPSTDARNEALANVTGDSSTKKSVFALEGKFVVDTVFSTANTADEAVSIGSEITLTFGTVSSFTDLGTVKNGATLTFLDNQGVEATFKVGTDGTEVVSGNGTSSVKIKLGKPSYKGPQGVAFNHKATITLSGATGISNHSSLPLSVPPYVNVTK